MSAINGNNEANLDLSINKNIPQSLEDIYFLDRLLPDELDDFNVESRFDECLSTSNLNRNVESSFEILGINVKNSNLVSGNSISNEDSISQDNSPFQPEIVFDSFDYGLNIVDQNKAKTDFYENSKLVKEQYCISNPEHVQKPLIASFNAKHALNGPNYPKNKLSKTCSDDHRYKALKNSSHVSNISNSNFEVYSPTWTRVTSPQNSQIISSLPSSSSFSNFSKISQDSSSDSKIQRFPGNTFEEVPDVASKGSNSIPLINIADDSSQENSLSDDNGTKSCQSTSLPQRSKSQSVQKTKPSKIYYRSCDNEGKERKYHYCEECKYKCKASCDFEKHIIRKHTRKFKYTCLFCGRGYITPKELEVHVEKKHMKEQIDSSSSPKQ